MCVETKTSRMLAADVQVDYDTGYLFFVFVSCGFLLFMCPHQVSVFDSSVLDGDAVWEVVRVCKGKVVCLDRCVCVCVCETFLSLSLLPRFYQAFVAQWSCRRSTSSPPPQIPHSQQNRQAVCFEAHPPHVSPFLRRKRTHLLNCFPFPPKALATTAGLRPSPRLRVHPSIRRHYGSDHGYAIRKRHDRRGSRKGHADEGHEGYVFKHESGPQRVWVSSLVLYIVPSVAR